MHTGFKLFWCCSKRFISASRYHPNNDDHFEISVEYQAIADFNNKYLLLVDPMLATGQSIIAVFNRLMEGVTRIHIAVVRPRDAHENTYTDTCHLWVASLDKLDERSYIVPGLGDAGDLSYGTKL
jgi:uracil phosphoribosyltransferase